MRLKLEGKNDGRAHFMPLSYYKMVETCPSKLLTPGGIAQRPLQITRWSGGAEGEQLAGMGRVVQCCPLCSLFWQVAFLYV
jgi:hypothetical protein